MKNKTGQWICPQCGPVDSSSERCEWCFQPLTWIDEEDRTQTHLLRVAARGYRLLFLISCFIIIIHFLGHFFGLL